MTTAPAMARVSGGHTSSRSSSSSIRSVIVVETRLLVVVEVVLDFAENVVIRRSERVQLGSALRAIGEELRDSGAGILDHSL